MMEKHTLDGVSIHASAREATCSARDCLECKNVSIHASAREATISEERMQWNITMFQSTPPHGRRPPIFF